MNKEYKSFRTITISKNILTWVRGKQTSGEQKKKFKRSKKTQIKKRYENNIKGMQLIN